MVVAFSIIVCTYNPKQKVFKRLLSALEALQVDGIVVEVLIIDNNSNPSLKNLPYINKYLLQDAKVRIVTERNPGLTAARLAGIKEAQYDWLVFFDDDNEPDSDYIIALQECIGKYPRVAFWGTGNISVQFTDAGTPEWLNEFKEFFQERHFETTITNDDEAWRTYYPPGTGMAVRKELALAYCKKVNDGIYKLTDRKGKSLSSGGDFQMALTVIGNGYITGISPALKLNHLIGREKANFRYLIRLAHGTSASNLPAHYQHQPFDVSSFEMHSASTQFKKLYYHLKVVRSKYGWRMAVVRMSQYFGELEGIMQIRPEVKPGLLQVAFNKFFL